MPQVAESADTKSAKTDPPNEASDRRDQILAAAEVCFRSRGVDATTMEEIARQAGLSRATVYRHFSTKDALLLDITVLRSREILEHGAALMAQERDMASAVETAIVYAVTEFPCDPWISEVMNLDPLVALSNATMLDLVREAFRPFIDRFRARGELRTDVSPDELLTWIVLNAFMIYRWERTTESEIRRVVRTFLMPAIHQAPELAAAPSRPAGVAEIVERLERLERRIEVLTDIMTA